VYVLTSGCLEVCKLGPVVFYSGDKTWYTRVTPDVAQRIVQEHLVAGNKLTAHQYPSIATPFSS
jgi:(2Fe-2S) ferredoxin